MKREQSYRRRGVTVWYAVFLMIGLCMLLSLAVDYGRCQVVKTELLRAADSAARAAASKVPVDFATAKQLAIDYAKLNKADGYAVDLKYSDDPNVSDIVFGTWDATTKKFTPLPVVSFNSANAVKVIARRSVGSGNAVPLLLASVLGRKSCNVSATTIAQMGTFVPNFIGLKYVSGLNNASMGYDPKSGTPDPSNPVGGAVLGSNGAITFLKNPEISGAVVLGPNGTFNATSPIPMKLKTDLSYPATEKPPKNATVRTLTLSSGETHHVTEGGVLVYSSITLNNNCVLIFDKPVTVYVLNDVIFNQNCEIKPLSEDPGDLRIRMIGSANSYFGGDNSNNVTVTAQIYAPNTDFLAKNNGEIRGSALFRSIDAANNLSLFYDIRHGSVVPGTPGPIAIVK